MAAAVLVVGAALALRPSAPARGTVRIELPAPAAGAEIELDQKRYAFDDLAEPLTLPAGSHLLAVSKPGSWSGRWP